MVYGMSFSTYIVVLAIGGLVIGALSEMLGPRGRTGAVAAAAVFGLLWTVIVGIWIIEFFETQWTVGLPLALAVAVLCMSAPLRSGGGGGSLSPWGGDASGGGADGGGGDGGGGGGGD